MSTHHRKPHAKRRLDCLTSSFARWVATTQASEPFWRLIRAVRSGSRLLEPFPNRGCTNPYHVEQILQACVRMSRCEDVWLRSPEDWTAPSANPFVQFRSLVSHLFDSYPVPNFMFAAWLQDDGEQWQRDLYLHLAGGRGIRQFPFVSPVRITKQTSRFFMQAPDDLSPVHALRWAHVRSLQGDGQLARLLVSQTVLGTLTPEETFWDSVIRFIIRHQPISDTEAVAIVRFIHEQRFQSAEIVAGAGLGPRPLQPNFSLDGRALISLRRHMANWRAELRVNWPRYVPPVPQWERTPIGSFHTEVGDLSWSIDELLTAGEVWNEGRLMQHCVASYIPRCARRWTSIWSMQVRKGERQHRLLTIEIDPATRVIQQAKGRRNLPPCRPALEILRQWASQEDLKFEGTA